MMSGIFDKLFESQIIYLYPIVLVFAFNLFPSSWKAWSVAAILVLPAYLYLAVLLADAPIEDRHGYVESAVRLLLFPAIIGNLTCAAGIFARSRVWPQISLLVIYIAGALVLAAASFLAPSLMFAPIEYPVL
jgi:peptidoglycan/LPS O-acetylase OafA/YrhL